MTTDIDVEEVKAGYELIKEVIQDLNGARSVVLEVDNNTDSTLTRVSDHHDHGGFAVPPKGAIAPRAYDVFGSQSKAWSVGTGTEGTVTYSTDEGAIFTVYWDNPFIGGNSCSASIAGPHANRYRVVYTCGAGDENAQMRYELFEWRVQGAIRDLWLVLGGKTGFLGYALTDETPTPDGRGRYNHFEGGSIYWTPETGAHEVHGLIRGRWAELGWEQSALGYPVTDETDEPDGSGRYNIFEHGSLHWNRSTNEVTVLT